MTTKHQPATPLPWIEGCDPRLSCGHSKSGADGLKQAAADMRFARHAANAYPRLVEALRDAIELIDMLGAACPDRIYDGEKGNPVNASAKRALLRELGEEA